MKLSSPFSDVVAVFPGQGSQHVGMTQELYSNFSIVREIFEEASDAIHVDLKKLCFEGPEEILKLTENTQPCLLVCSVATFEVVKKEFDFFPGAVAGHSLGEYSALVAAGSLDLAQTTRWVRERGLAMQRAVPPGEGSMAAILGVEDPIILNLCKKATERAIEARKLQPNTDQQVTALVEPANFNAPGQIVIAGSCDAVQEAMRLIQSDPEFSGGKAIPLQVSAPFHCQLMRPARTRMAEIFSELTASEQPKPLSCPYVPNRTGSLSKERELVLELLIDQIDHPVLWRQSISLLLNSNFKTILEFGPGKVLTGLNKRIANQLSKNCTLRSISDTESFKILPQIFKSNDTHSGG